MVEHWDKVRKTLPGNEAVMITDATNLERDQVNAMAQERRIQAGELGAHQVELPGKPYGLRAGDEVIFTAQFRGPRPAPGQKWDLRHRDRHQPRDEDNRVTLKTKQLEPREVHVDTSEFSDLSLRYAVHIVKAQGITAERSGIMTGGWQTDREHIYTELTRAREETQIYVSREDLGEQGFDIGAMERLAETMQRSRAQEASITKKIAKRGPERQQATERPQQREHATNVDRSGDVGEQAREVEAIEHLAEHLRNEGASEATITQEIAKQTAGREVDLERNTQAQAEHERYIDQVLQQQRQRLLDEEQNLDRDRDNDLGFGIE